MCRRRGLDPAEFPLPSRQALGWLRLLARRDILAAHVAALRLVARVAPPSLSVRFFHTSALWRVKVPPGGKASLVASEAFITAPDEVLEALVRLAGGRRSRSPRDRAVVRDYAAGAAFAALIRDLDAGGPGPVRAGTSRGRHYDLEEVFARVNQACFGGEMERPLLVWSRAPTRRKFGHYQPVTGTVMLSRTLDSPRVPAFVVDFVMYHELLHKRLGVGVTNGRQRAHTAAFRREERAYPRYEEAERLLRQVRGRQATSVRRR